MSFSSQIQNSNAMRDLVVARIPRQFAGHFRSALTADFQSDDERPLWIERRLGANMLNPPARVVAQVVEPETVLRRLDLAAQCSLQHRPLCRIYQALENRVLNPLPPVLAYLRYPAQSPPPNFVIRPHVVGNQHRSEEHTSELQSPCN